MPAALTFNKADAGNSKPSKSHYDVRGKALNPDRLTEWTKPVDYRTGTAHVRLEVWRSRPAGGHHLVAVLHPDQRAKGRVRLRRHRRVP